MSVDAVPKLPFEIRVPREDGRVVAQRLPQENLLRTGGVARVDLEVAVGDAARRAENPFGRARYRIQAQNEAGHQAKSNSSTEGNAYLRAPRNFLHVGLRSRPNR
jgi:hypothetical protein